MLSDRRVELQLLSLRNVRELARWHAETRLELAFDYAVPRLRVALGWS
jgi:hypothetical protein